MLPRMLFACLGAPLIAALTACGPDYDTPLLAGSGQAQVSEGQALYQQAQAADKAGKVPRAIKLYKRTATRYPYLNEAGKARYRQAQLLEQQGDRLEAFDAYQEFLTGFHSSPDYPAALARQAEIANAAAEGGIHRNFLGLKTKLGPEKIITMLGQVRDNAPRSTTAARAQLEIGEIYRKDKQSAKAIEAYRKLVRDQPESAQAPNAMFQIGVALTEEADRGNQNLATIDLAREAFNDYLNQYPGHSRNTEARLRIAALGSRDLNRSMDIAEFYHKTKQTESAKVYYRDIVKRAGSGPLHDRAKTRLQELGN